MSKNQKVLIFAGTVEGRLLTEYLASKKIETVVCVATEYGKKLFSENNDIKSLSGRLTQGEMVELIDEIKPSIVVDSTHPYADFATENIKGATEKTGVSYLRLLRPSEDIEGENTEDVEIFSDVKSAVDYLKTTKGNIFLTTGSKDLKYFTEIEDYQNRVFPRVLSLPQVVMEASKLGFQGKNLICMQGPFSKEINTAMLRQTNSKILVTKETGNAGGFKEKLQSAKEVGAKVVIIGRPTKEEGLDFSQCKKFLREKLRINPEISIVGIGMGNPKNLTIEAREEIDRADLIIGATRMTESMVSGNIVSRDKDVFQSYKPKEIAEFIENNPKYEKIVIIQSGDVGFYSGSKKLLKILPDYTKVFSGISAPVYFCGKLKTSWEDVVLTSLHGISSNIVSMVQKNKKVFALLSDENSVADICQKLQKYGLDDVTVNVGERLSYSDETITTAKARELVGIKTNPLAVVLIENPLAKEYFTIRDEEFLRDKVPMTKEEIRSISLSKLMLQENSVVYDIGAGTGSVSVEMARRCHKVYAIEKKEVATKLLEENKVKFAVDNLEVVTGLAPKAMENLPKPTHGFIGGSSGNLREILQSLRDKNSEIRIVINAITLETVGEALVVVKTMDVKDTDIVCVNVAKSQSIGNYHLMNGMNPVYIISFSFEDVKGGQNELQ